MLQAFLSFLYCKAKLSLCMCIIHGLYNREKVLNFSSHHENSLNLVRVLEKCLISLLGLEKSLKFNTLFMPHHFCENY